MFTSRLYTCTIARAHTQTDKDKTISHRPQFALTFINKPDLLKEHKSKESCKSYFNIKPYQNICYHKFAVLNIGQPSIGLKTCHENT